MHDWREGLYLDRPANVRQRSLDLPFCVPRCGVDTMIAILSLWGPETKTYNGLSFCFRSQYEIAFTSFGLQDNLEEQFQTYCFEGEMVRVHDR